MAILPDDVRQVLKNTAIQAPAPSSLPGNEWIKEAEAQGPAQPSSGGPLPMRGNEAPKAAPAKEGTDSAPALLTVSFGDFVRDFKPLQWLIYGYIQGGALQMLFGPSGAGKSFVALDMALHVAAKKAMEDAADPAALAPKIADIETWHGQTTHGGRVLYVAGEGVNGLKKRALGWAQFYGFNPDTLNNYFRFSPRALPLDNEDDPPALGEWHKLLIELDALRARCAFVPDLIIFDTLKANMTGEENSAKESSVVISRAQELVDGRHNPDGHGATVLFIHHTGWGLEAKGRGRGSSAWRGAMDIDLSISHGVKHEAAPGDDPIMGGSGKAKKIHYAIVDAVKVKDDEPQPRLYLERDSILILDESGFPIPSPQEGKMETTLILKTVEDPDSMAAQVKIDGDEDQKDKGRGGRNGKHKGKGAQKEGAAASGSVPPAKEEATGPEELSPDEQALLALSETGFPAELPKKKRR